MGLIYTTGVISGQPNAAAVGTAMAERIRDDLVAHEAWELVEEYSPGTVVWYVYKCLATESGLSADFYIVVARVISTGQLRFSVCETYTQATHIMAHYPRSLGSGSPVWDAQGRSPSTLTLGTGGFPGGAADPIYITWLPSGTSTNWWIIVGDDGFTIAFNGASNGFVHAGAYIPLCDEAIALPVQIIGTDNDGGITRNPAVAGDTSAISESPHRIRAGGGASTPQGKWLGFSNDFGGLNKTDALNGNRRLVVELGMVIAGTNPDILGYALGKQKRMRYSEGSQAAGITWGDSFSIEGTLWVPYNPGNNRIFDTGVAA